MRIDEAMRSTPAEERQRLAVYVYGYLLFVILFGVVVTAAGLKKAIPHPFDELTGADGLMLAPGTAVYVAADAGMLQLLGIASGRLFGAAALVVLVTIPVGR